MIVPIAPRGVPEAVTAAMAGQLLISLRTAAKAVLRHPATQPDHLLIFADALHETARELSLVNSAAAGSIQQLSQQLRDIAPLLA